MVVTANLIVDSKLRRQFDVDGYAVAPLLNADDVSQLLTVYREIHSGCLEGFYTTLWSTDIEYRRRVHEAIWSVVHPRLGYVLRPGQFFINQFAVKKANEKGSACPLHQDWSFVDETQHRAISIWCPLVDVDSTNGCLALIPGSHLASPWLRPNQPKDRYRSPFDQSMGLLAEKYLKEVPVKAGECILYDGGILHGSKPNQSPVDRPAIVAVLAPRDTPIRHYWYATNNTVEVFNVDETFFWREVTWGTRPKDRHPVDTIQTNTLDTQVTEQGYLDAYTAAKSALRPAEPATPRSEKVSTSQPRRIFVDSKMEDDFTRNGFVTVQLLPPDDVARLHDIFVQSATPKVAGFHGTLYHNDADYRQKIDHAIRPVLSRAITNLLDNYRLSVCNYMVKEPADDASEMPLHQDWSFVDEPHFRSVHVWCPLVDVNHENGNLAVVPGSHHLSDTVRAFADDCPFREQFPMIRARYVRELPMKAGDAVLFDGRLIHSSPPNRSANRRITAQGIGVPKEASLYHSWRINPNQVEVYPVTDEFFFDYILHQPPQGITPERTVEYAVRQFSADEVAELEKYRQENSDLVGASY